MTTRAPKASEPPWRTKLKGFLATVLLGWELFADHFNHWPGALVAMFWLLGGPVESLITFFTAGRVQITMPDDKPKPERDE